MTSGTGDAANRRAADGRAAEGESEHGALDGALARFRDVLAADGYLLNWSVTGEDRVVVRIVAGEGACAECLVPMPVMEAILSDALGPTRYALDRVVLPAIT